MVHTRHKAKFSKKEDAKTKKNNNFKPLPETLKPANRHGHRVHLTKTELDGEVVPDHPQAVNTRGSKGFYNARNGGVDYYRTLPYIPASMTDGKSDFRSRSESPRRARAAREKYWSYRLVNPTSQRNMFHLDINPPTDREGNKRYWSDMTPVLPSEAPIVMPSKRELFNQAQEGPRPPRRHHAERFRQLGVDNPRRMDELRCIDSSDSWSYNKTVMPRKNRMNAPKHTEHHQFTLHKVSDGGMNMALAEMRYLPQLLDLEFSEAELLEQHFGGDVQPVEPNDGADFEGDSALQNQRNVDALFETAEQKHVLKQAAKRKKLQKQGWDVWDDEDLMSPEPEWEDVDDDLGEWELETTS